MPSENRKVMMLDDNILSLMIAEDVLTKSGYDVVKLTASHGWAAKLDYEQPDVLLVDITMPRLPVDDLIDTVGGTTEHDDLAVVLYADLEAAELERMCRERNLHGYFCKSMDIRQLPEFVDQFF